MITSDLNVQELVVDGPVRVAFPVTGQAAAASVYFELDPGEAVGSHADSAEEIVLVMAGTAEAMVGDERGALAEGQLAVIPANVPHDVRNVGDDVVKVVGFFAAGTVLSTFADPPFPGGPTLFVNGQPVAPVDTTLPV